jgi:hypothetical protein
MQKGTNVVKYNWLLSGGTGTMDDYKVAILLEDFRIQFKIFGEGLEMLNNKVDKGFLQLHTRLDRHISENRQEHQMMIQMVKDLNLGTE